MQSFIVRSSPESREVCVRVVLDDMAMVTRPGDHARPAATLHPLPIRSALTVADILAAQFDTDVCVVGKPSRH